MSNVAESISVATDRDYECFVFLYRLAVPARSQSHSIPVFVSFRFVYSFIKHVEIDTPQHQV